MPAAIFSQFLELALFAISVMNQMPNHALHRNSSHHQLFHLQCSWRYPRLYL